MANANQSEALPAPTHTIQTLEALKVFSDTLRQQIIEVLLEGPKTVKQIASELDLAPTKLYYHINLLEQHELIMVTETQIVSGIIEKHYTAAAREFQIERSLLTPGQPTGNEALGVFLNAMIEPICSELDKSLKQGLIDVSEDAPEQRRFRMWRAMSRLNDEQAAEFYKRLNALVDEFNTFKDGEPTKDGETSEQHYGLLIGIYPAAAKKPPKS